MISCRYLVPKLQPIVFDAIEKDVSFKSDYIVYSICKRVVEILFDKICCCITQVTSLATYVAFLSLSQILERNKMGLVADHIHDIYVSRSRHVSMYLECYEAQAKEGCCQFCVGNKGRELRSLKNMTSGKVYLRESPLLCLPLLTCSNNPKPICCRDGSGTLPSHSLGGALLTSHDDAEDVMPCCAGEIISQHIQLAFILTATPNSSSDSLLSSFLNTFRPPLVSSFCPSERDTPQPAVDANKSVHSRGEALQGLRDAFQSGWSTSQQVVMSTICVVVSMLISRYSSAVSEWDDVESAGRAVDGWTMYEALIRIPHNSHAIHKMKQSQRLGTTGILSDVRQQRYAVALFPLASAVNHSCAPAATFRYTFNPSTTPPCGPGRTRSIYFSEEVYRCFHVELVATKSILPGAEVCVSYGPTSVQPVQTRRRLLQESYCFDCTCDLCLSQLPSPQCSNSREDGATDLSIVTESGDAEIRQAIAKCAEDMQRVSSRCRTSVLGSSEEAGTEMSSILRRMTDIGSMLQSLGNVSVTEVQSQWVRTMCVCLDTLGEHAARKGNHREAVDYIEQAIQLMTDPVANPLAVTADDITIARERVKVVELLWAAGESLRAYDIALQVQAQLFAYVDVHADPDYLEMTEIIHCVELRIGARTS